MKKLFLLLLTFIFISNIYAADIVIDKASLIKTNTSNFDGILNSNDTTVQKVLDKVDNFAESDPKILTVTTDKWCKGTGTQVDCATNTPVTVESDPTFDTQFLGKTQDNLLDGATAKQYNPAVVAITGGSATGLTNLATSGTLGTDKVTNGTFDADVSWTKGTGWTIDTANSNVAEMAAGAASVLSQDISAVAGEEYKVTCTVTFTAGNWVLLNLGGATGAPRIVSGTVTEYITANKTGSLFIIEKSASTSGTVDNCSVQKVTNGGLTVEGTTVFRGKTQLKEAEDGFNISTSSDTGWGGLGFTLEGFPSTDVGWNIVTDRNTYGSLSQENSTDGGLTIWGISTDGDGNIVPLSLRGAFELANPDDTVPAVNIEGYKWDGAVHVSTLGVAETVISFNNAHYGMAEFMGDSSFYLNNDLNFKCQTYTENPCTVAHGMTTLARTDISGAIARADDDLGGLKISGYNETGADGALQLRGVLGSTNPTDTIGAIKVTGGKKSGTDIAALGATETVVSFYNNATSIARLTGGGSFESILSYDLIGTPGQFVHGVTDIMPEGAAGSFWVENVTDGGVELIGVSEGATYGLKLTSILGTSDPTDTVPAINITAEKQDGAAGVAALGANETMLQIINKTTLTFALYGDGDAAFTGKIRNTVQSVTCTAGAGVSALTINPTSSYVEITNSDAEGCDITMGETGAVVGDITTLCIASNAGGVVTFADSAGVSELAGAFAADIDDCITLRYGNTTTWREASRSAN